MFVGFYLRVTERDCFPLTRRLASSLSSSPRTRHKFSIRVHGGIRPGKKKDYTHGCKKQSPSGQKEEGRRGVKRESEGGVEGFFLKKKKKHLEKQSGINKQAGFHCPPNK